MKATVPPPGRCAPVKTSERSRWGNAGNRSSLAPAAPSGGVDGEMQVVAPLARSEIGNNVSDLLVCLLVCHWAACHCAGGANRSRTGDLLNAIQALSQLSYGPTRGSGV